MEAANPGRKCAQDYGIQETPTILPRQEYSEDDDQSEVDRDGPDPCCTLEAQAGRSGLTPLLPAQRSFAESCPDMVPIVIRARASPYAELGRFSRSQR